MWIGQFGPPSSRKRKNATDTTPSAYIPIPKPQCGAAIKQQRSEEDFVNVMRVRMGEERLRFFGVFDGHDGKDRVNSSHVAHHVCNTLPRRLFDTVTNPTVCNLDKEVEVMEAIKTVVLHLDREMYESEQFHAGTCCTALLIDDKRHVMYPINLGDSRTILFCYPSQHILFVTKDHDWESEIESARARAAGASIRYGRMRKGGENLEGFIVEDVPSSEKKTTSEEYGVYDTITDLVARAHKSKNYAEFVVLMRALLKENKALGGYNPEPFLRAALAKNHMPVEDIMAKIKA